MKGLDVLNRAASAFEYIGNEILLQSVLETSMYNIQGTHVYLSIVRAYAIEKNAFHLVEPLEKLARESMDMAKFGKEEIEGGFPTFLSHSSVAMWSAVEALVEDILVGAIGDNEIYIGLLKEKYPSLKIKDSHTADMIVKNWGSSLKSKRYAGDRYVEMLSLIFDGFEIEQQYVDDISELAEIRNAIMHRMGIVDVRLVEKFPDRNFNLGDKIIVTKEMYSKYHIACGKFVIKFFDERITRRELI